MTNICPISSKKIVHKARYSQSALLRLNPNLNHLDVLPLSSNALRQEAALRADKMSIQGAQPKLVASFSVTTE